MVRNRLLISVNYFQLIFLFFFLGIILYFIWYYLLPTIISPNSAIGRGCESVFPCCAWRKMRARIPHYSQVACPKVVQCCPTLVYYPSLGQSTRRPWTQQPVSWWKIFWKANSRSQAVWWHAGRTLLCPLQEEPMNADNTDRGACV